MFKTMFLRSRSLLAEAHCCRGAYPSGAFRRRCIFVPRGVSAAVAASKSQRACSVSFPLAPSRRGGSDGWEDATTVAIVVVHVDDDGGDQPGTPLLDPNFSRTHRTVTIGDGRCCRALPPLPLHYTPTPRLYWKKEGTNTVIVRPRRRSRIRIYLVETRFSSLVEISPVTVHDCGTRIVMVF